MRIYIANGIQNISLQVGDKAYYKSDNGPAVKLLGPVLEIGLNFIKVAPEANIEPGAFLMFAKDARVNNSSLVGYYASVNLINDSTDKTELFALSSEAAISSK